MAVNPSDSAARVVSRKLRCSSPRRAGACSAGVSDPATRAHSSYSSVTDVSRPVPTLNTPPSCPSVETVARATSPTYT